MLSFKLIPLIFSMQSERFFIFCLLKVVNVPKKFKVGEMAFVLPKEKTLDVNASS